MFNVTILKGKDILKFILGIAISIFMIIVISRSFNKEKGENSNQKIATNLKLSINSLAENAMISSIDQVMPNIKTKEENKINKKEENILEDILKTQISALGQIDEEKEKKEKIEEKDHEIEENNETKEENSVEVAKTGLPTEVITQNPIAENANVEYGNVKIKNQTTYELTEEMLNPNIEIENKNIVLFHTHTCESYTASDKYNYTPTGNFRTTDLNFSVARVGVELENQLKQYNHNVIHNTTYHDYPNYTGSYTRSLETVENILKDNPSDIIIDLHRDAIGSRSDYAPIVKIGDEDIAAQIMFVIGTNEGGLWHPNWNQNLKFAIKLQQKAEEMYPGLFKPIMLTKSRYNQHTSKFASIIEVGATGNTLDQCLTSMKYLAKVIDEIMK